MTRQVYGPGVSHIGYRTLGGVRIRSYDMPNLLIIFQRSIPLAYQVSMTLSPAFGDGKKVFPVRYSPTNTGP